MAFNRFKQQILIRVVALQATLLLLVYFLFTTNYYVSSAILILLTVWQIVSLLNFADNSNLLFSRLLDSIRYDDFTRNYAPKGLGTAYDQLNEQLNQVLAKFRDIRAEREAQYFYLESIVQHIPIGMLVFDQAGQVRLLNQATQQLLRIGDLKHIEDLKKELQPLLDCLNTVKGEERELIKIEMPDGIRHLAVRIKILKLRNQVLKIVSLQDIQSELDEKEMEAWQNLIRVLTHEIINSVTPIASIAATLNADLTDHQARIDARKQADPNNPHILLPANFLIESFDELYLAIKTIRRRSEGLIRFVQDFRNLTKIPIPKVEAFALRDLIETILVLMREEFKNTSIVFHYHIFPPDLQLQADLSLLEQVLINLVKNAGQAIQEKQNPQEDCLKVELKAYAEANGSVVIQVQDNGVGISEEAQKKIFIPFYTTKRAGSGIGLSFSKQVMRLHGGSISIYSKQYEGTIFTLRFPAVVIPHLPAE
ncbi:MAG TPA: ATP-binding protein [Microscillaceae bacterium]|jgi:nitrogen fixation/metabolism regulation signal transduction histidine kinase|nr:ATP-binding protein [Microscillaceae bacterium]